MVGVSMWVSGSAECAREPPRLGIMNVGENVCLWSDEATGRRHVARRAAGRLAPGPVGGLFMHDSVKKNAGKTKVLNSLVAL